MAIDLSTEMQQVLVDAAADVFDTPDGGVLEIRTGAAPGADAAAGGTLLASIDLPATPWGAASGADPATASKSGTWEDPSADAAGTAAHFRLRQSGDGNGSSSADERIEGSITLTSGGGDLELDNTSIEIGQTITITTFDLTHG